MINLKELKNEVNGAFSNNAATGSLDKASAVNQAIDWIALRYDITEKPGICPRTGMAQA